MLWTLILRAADLVFWVALALVLFGLVVGNRKPAKVLTDGRVEFPPNWIIVWASVLIDLRMGIIAAEFLMNGVEKPLEFMTGALLGLAVLVPFFVLPGTIVVSGEGIEQASWLGKNKRIRWEAIAKVSGGVKDRQVTITARDKTRIVHSHFLADRPRLLLELKQHGGDNLPVDFPRESIKKA